MVITDRNGIPIAARHERASPAEVTLVQETLDSRWTSGVPENLLGENPYDSDKLVSALDAQGIVMIYPKKSNRIIKIQHGRQIRR